MTRQLAAVILGAAFAATALAQTTPNLPPIRMELVGVADGPFKETRIFKLRDRDAGTICYVYVPQHIQPGHICPSTGPCVPVINSQMGSISCVKDAPLK